MITSLLRKIPFYSWLAATYGKSPFFSKRFYIRPLEALLRREIRGKREFRILEIGTEEGASAIVWAKVCADCGVGHVDTIDWFIKEGQFERCLRRTRPYAGRISIIKGNADAILPTLKERYDFIFIDGGHSYTQSKKDMLNSMPLLKEGGVLCGDDLELQAHEVDRGVMERHKEDDTVVDPQTGKAYHPGVSLAVAEILGRASKNRVFWAFRKVRGDWQPIAL